jgi:hypothetical protein
MQIGWYWRDRIRRWQALVVVLLLATLGTAVAGAQTPVLRTSKNLYAPGEPIEIVFEGMSSVSRDWVALASCGQADRHTRAFQYVRGGTSGRMQLRSPGPGEYEARAYRGRSYEVLVRHPFVVASRLPDATLRAKATYAPGEPIEIAFDGMPGHGKDRIVLVRQGADEPVAPQHYLRGATSGSARFRGLQPGEYEARLHQEGGCRVLARHAFSIAGPATLARASQAPAETAKGRTGAETKPIVTRPERPRPGAQGREPAAPTPEPTSRGPLTGVWEGELPCKGAAKPARVRVALIHFGDTTVRAEVTLETTGPDDEKARARYHAYGTTRETRANRYGDWHTLYHVRLDPGGWIEQPEGMRFGSNIRAYQSEPGASDLSAEIGGLQGCTGSTKLARVSEEPALAAPPPEVAKRLADLRYPARRGDRNWSVPAVQLFADFADSPFGDAADNAGRCAVLGRWVERVTTEYQEPDRIDQGIDDARRARARKLFTDPTFEPVFGRPVDQLSAPARRFIAANSLDHCGRGAADIEQWLQVFLRQGLHLVPQEVARVDAVARAHREALVRRQEAIAELEALPTEAASHARMAAQAERATTALDPLWPSERTSFDQALERTHRRLAEVTLRARLAEAVRASEDLAGAQALAGFRATNAALLQRVPDALASAARGRIEARLDEVLKAAAAAELGGLATRGAGLAAVAAGNAWHESFTKRYAGFLERAPVTAAIDGFRRMRAEDLARAQAELLAAVKAADSIGKALELQNSTLVVPGDWETPAGKTLRTALRERRAQLYAALESSNARFWPLSEHSPYEESLSDASGRLRVPASYPEPRPHEILLGVVRAVANHSGERIGGNTVRYKLPSLKRAVLSAPQINPVDVFNIPDIDLPVYARLEFQRARKLGCRPADTRGYVCRYELASHVDSGLFAGGGSQVVEDHFVLGPSGWVTTTVGRRLGGASLETWGILADGVVKGLKRGACLRALPGDPRCR